MSEREFDGQLAVAPAQWALLQAVQEKLAALACSLNAVPDGSCVQPVSPSAREWREKTGLGHAAPAWQLP